MTFSDDCEGTLDAPEAAMHPFVGRDALLGGEDLVVELREHPALELGTRDSRDRTELVAWVRREASVREHKDDDTYE